MNSVSVSIRFPKDLRDDLKKIARANNRSLNGEVIFRLGRYVTELKSMGTSSGSGDALWTGSLVERDNNGSGSAESPARADGPHANVPRSDGPHTGPYYRWPIENTVEE